MNNPVYVNRLIAVIIIVIIIGITTGIGFYCKWIFYDEPRHIKYINCNITYCNVTTNICSECTDTRNCNLHTYYFTCYVVNIIVTAHFNGQNYTRNIKKNNGANYPTICNNNITTCDYDDRDIQNTLNVYKIYAIEFAGYLSWFVVVLVATVIIISLIIILSRHLKFNSEYVEIKDDVEIAMSINST
jgi:hypothetical protein